MPGILPAEVQEFGASLGRGRGLSRRQVAKRVRIGQVWVDAEGWRWRVANVHRKDGQVHLELRTPIGPHSRFATFADLGREYELVEDAP